MNFCQQDFATALLDSSHPIASQPIGEHGRASSRFTIYRNNVSASLINALADTFPVCQALVGEDFFRAMALEFVRAHPPKTRILAYYGDAFPDFVRCFPPAASVPYLADVAQLEYRRVLSYHAADDVSVRHEALAALLNDAEQINTARFALHAAVHVVKSEFGVFSLWAAHQGACAIESVDPRVAETALIFRRGLDVQTMAIAAATGALIMELKRGATLIEAIETAQNIDPDFALTDTLALLIRENLITAIHTSS
jgi:hypothetical protein